MSRRTAERSLAVETIGRLARHPSFVAGATIIGFFALAALLAPVVAPYDPLEINLSRRLEPPGPDHLLGADFLGRDVLSRLLYGARISLQVGFAVGLFSLVVGGAVGVLSGYLGGRIDNVLMRMVDALLALPSIVLAIAIVAVFGPGLRNLIIAVGIGSIPQFARVARASTLVAKESPYVHWSLAAGSGGLRVMVRHIIPNIQAALLVLMSVRVGTAILTAAGLSFLGLGVQPPAPEWGAMLSEARTYLTVAPLTAMVPGIAIMLVVMGFNLLGDGLRDSFDPTL